jgi:hypothetical protein
LVDGEEGRSWHNSFFSFTRNRAISSKGVVRCGDFRIFEFWSEDFEFWGSSPLKEKMAAMFKVDW